MSADDDRERTESPSQKRLDDARRRGQVARSRDLNAAATTLTGGIGLYLLGDTMGNQFLQLMRSELSFSRVDATVPERMLEVLESSSAHALLALAPIMGLLMVAAVLAPLMIGGWTFSTRSLAPNFERLDPVAGVARMFSLRGVIEVAKSLARFGLVAAVAVVLLRQQFGEFTGLGAESTNTAVAHSLRLTGRAFIVMGGALGLLALIDVPLALWQHHRSLRMSRQELRDESKDTDGSPEVRGRIRRIQQDTAKKRMMADVPKAHVIVTNPTHYAVALRYVDDRMRAPVVVAKGVDLIALQIRKVAGAHAVPIVEAPPLARALHASCELGAEIPSRLYAAVAQLLTYVYQLKAAVSSGKPLPVRPQIDVPAHNREFSHTRQ
jgi:flagellar biosynthetic protein FlhB